MKTHASTMTLAALTLLGTTILTGIPAATAAGATHDAGAATPSKVEADLTNRQIMAPFRDEWGQTDVQPTGITDWRTASSWDRAAQYAFAPGTDETTGTPTRESGLAPLHMDVVSRQNNGTTEYEVRETADDPGGQPILNYFPIFTGTPDEGMAFYNAAGIPGLPAGEIHQTCRGLDESGQQHFLACRMIASDGSIHYQVKVTPGSSADLPGINAVMQAFRDQWGTTTFAPSGATAWKPISKWQRFDGLDFNEGDDETHGTPSGEGFDTPDTVQLTLWVMVRTVNGEQQFTERDLATFPDGTTREDGFVFGRISGSTTDWFEQENPLSDVGEYRQHRKVVTIEGQQYLDNRTLKPQPDGSHSIVYYIFRPSS